MILVTLIDGPEKTTWGALHFVKGEPVEIDESNAQHRHILEKARGSQFFTVDEDAAEVIYVAPEPVSEPVATPDYIPVDQMAEMDERTLREALKALGINPGGRSSVETLRAKLEKAYAENV